MNNGFKKSLAIILSVIMLLSAAPLVSFAQYDAGGTGYTEYEEMAYNEGFYNATNDQVASMLFDLLDYVLENEAGDFILQLTDPSDGDVKLDFTRITDTDKLLAELYDIFANDRLGGSFNDFDATALSGLSRDIGDLKLGYALLDFVDANANILKTLLTGSFDFGKVIEYYPQLQVVNDFDVNSLILSAFGLDPADENRTTADEFLQSIVKDGVEDLFGSAKMNCSLDILKDSAYDFAHNILTAVFTSEALTSADVCEFIQQIRIMGIDANRYVKKAISIAPDDDEFAAIESMFKAEYGTGHPIAAMTRTETSNGEEFLVYYVPIFGEDEDGTPVYSYSKIYTLDYPVTYLSIDDVTAEQQTTLAAEYGLSTQSVWTSATGDKYLVKRSYEAPFTPKFQKYVAEGYTIMENDNTEIKADVLADGTLIKGNCPEGTLYESISYQGLIADQKQFLGEEFIGYYVPDEYNCWGNRFENAYTENIEHDIYAYKGKTYIYLSGNVILDHINYDPNTGTTISETKGITAPVSKLYELMSAPKLLTQIDLCFNFDFENLDYNSTANGGVIGELNHLVYNFVDMLIKDEVFEELALVDGANSNLSANLGKIIGMFWEPIKGILNLGGDVDGMFDTIVYDEAAGLQSYAISWMKCIFNSPDMMAGEFVTLGDEVTKVAQFAAVTIQKLFDMLAEDAGEEFADFNFNYKAQIYNVEGKVVTKTTAQWIDLLLNMGVDLGIFCLNKFVPNVGLSPEKVAEYKVAGWTWFDFLDEAVDWALRFVEGVAAISTDFAHQRGVTDGNGPWYKLSAILSDIVAPLAIFNCGKTYGDKYVPFDFGVLIVDKLLTGVFDLDLGKIFSFLETNTHESNVFYSNPAMTAALKTAQQAVNSILPGSIADEDVTSFDHVLENETLAGIAGKALTSLNARKMYLVPAVLEILAKAGLFDDIFMQGECGDNMTWKYSALSGILTISGYGVMYDNMDWKNAYYNSVVFENDTANGGITSIGNRAFYYTDNDDFKTIEIPATVTAIGEDAFNRYLKTVTVEAGNTAFTVDEYGVLYTADMTELVFVPGSDINKTIVIPDTVTAIRYRAFFYSSKYTVVFDNAMSLNTLEETVYPSEFNVSNVICHADSGIAAYCYWHQINYDYANKHFRGGDAIITPATCTTSGSWSGTCKYCDAVLTSEEIPALGHTQSNWIIDTDSTCSAEGTKHIECTVCHETIVTGIVEKKAHTPGGGWTVVTDATCTQVGSKTINCTVCGQVADTYETPALGHEPGEWVIDKAATCAEEGQKHTTCTRCDVALDNVIIAKTNDHTAGEWIETKAATCTTAGTKTQSCTVCGKSLATETTPRLTHSFGAWEEITAATCIANGNKQHTCSLCGKVETVDVPKSGHTAGAWIVDAAASCTAEGSQHKACTVCGATVESGSIAMIDHHDDNGDGNCDGCGKVLTEKKTSFIDKIREFFQRIADWFKSLFGG